MRHFLLAVSLIVSFSPVGARAATWSHDDRCAFFESEAAFMVQMRDRHMPWRQGARQLTYDFSRLHIVPGDGDGIQAGIETEYAVGALQDADNMTRDIWTHPVLNAEEAAAWAGITCGWRKF